MTQRHRHITTSVALMYVNKKYISHLFLNLHVAFCSEDRRTVPDTRLLIFPSLLSSQINFSNNRSYFFLLLLFYTHGLDSLALSDLELIMKLILRHLVEVLGPRIHLYLHRTTEWRKTLGVCPCLEQDSKIFS
jgi:hypothetical protein